MRRMFVRKKKGKFMEVNGYKVLIVDSTFDYATVVKGIESYFDNIYSCYYYSYEDMLKIAEHFGCILPDLNTMMKVIGPNGDATNWRLLDQKNPYIGKFGSDPDDGIYSLYYSGMYNSSTSKPMNLDRIYLVANRMSSTTDPCGILNIKAINNYAPTTSIGGQIYDYYRYGISVFIKK